MWVEIGTKNIIQASESPGVGWVEFTGDLIFGDVGNLDMVALTEPPYLRPYNAAELLENAQTTAKQAAEVERNRRIDLISGSNPDQWRPHIRNTAAAVDLTLRVALGTSTADDDAALVALKAELDAVEILETAYATLLAEIDACMTVAQVEAVDVTADRKWI